MSLSRKQKIIIFAMILVVCAIGGGVFYKIILNKRQRTGCLRIHFPGSSSGASKSAPILLSESG